MPPVRCSFRRAERQTRSPERTPDRRHDSTRLSAFSAKAEKVARRTQTGSVSVGSTQADRAARSTSAPSSRAGQPEPAHPNQLPAGPSQRAPPPDAERLCIRPAACAVRIVGPVKCTRCGRFSFWPDETLRRGLTEDGVPFFFRRACLPFRSPEEERNSVSVHSDLLRVSAGQKRKSRQSRLSATQRPAGTRPDGCSRTLSVRDKRFDPWSGHTASFRR